MAIKRRWSEEQKRAVVWACLDSMGGEGLSAARVAELAAAGRLPGPGSRLPAFPMPLGTVRDLAGKVRRERARESAIDGGAAEVVRTGAARLGALWLVEVEREERRRTHDPRRLAELAKAGREVEALRKVEEGGKGDGASARAGSSAGAGARAREGSEEERRAEWLEGLGEEEAETQGRGDADGAEGEGEQEQGERGSVHAPVIGGDRAA